MQNKQTLAVYSQHKINIGVVGFYNSMGGRFLFEARAGALQTLVYRKRYNSTVVELNCCTCD